MNKLRIIIVNTADEIIGYKERGTLLKKDLYRVSALWITNLRGDILLAQRQFNKRHDPGMWGPAVAGTVEDGETYQTNIVKEAEEEIGLVGVELVKGPKRRITSEYNYFCQWYTLVVDKSADKFVIQEEEVVQVRWFTRDELMQGLKDHPEHYLKDLDWNLENLS